MDKKEFAIAINKLIIEYQDKGFTMTPERLSQWYDFFKELPIKKFERMIDICLKECSYAPTMSNLYKGSYNDSIDNRYKDYTPEY